VAPTAAPTALPTAKPTGPGAILFSDTFADITHPKFPLSSTDSLRSQGYINGQYEIINGDQTGNGTSVAVPGTYSDDTIAIDVHAAGGPAEAGPYVSCRRNSTATPVQGYQFQVQPNSGQFSLYRYEPSGQPTLLLRQASSAINTGDVVNHLELTCAATTITLGVNGVPVGSVQDATYSSGQHRFGIIGGGAKADFTNLVVTQR